MGEDEAGRFAAACGEALRRAYRDLSRPRFDFVWEAVEREPCADVLRDLSAVCPVEDDTDVNCDVCFTYIARCERVLTVRLSMVGPYAMAYATGPDGFGEVSPVVAPEQCAGPGEAEVLGIVARHGFLLPTVEWLEREVRIALREDTDSVPLHAALFEPDGDLPWRRAG
ncbi:hypothetical protein F0L17_16170 [Streptomyces sp. TRM43335]|uniref:Uncharacterized protein n=1 Tax=Streptomyces taklimakanensis TaxID=2569853 RepID=A0A6G2BEA6_9ACTN|nr:hypothetical protein [Streptomyces taklimakanensis]MTE20615.1 hypothetical protein [Streptomyces taklimakanensis]